jgi:hypothetical protein
MTDRTDSTLLAFPANDAGEEEGLNHAGIETYRDTPYSSVARECGQNSADAAAAVPVEIRFDVIEISASEYPPRAAQQQAVEACLKKARLNGEEKSVDFFTRALEVLSAPAIKVLRIADYNTKGLVGPAVAGTPFHSLVKSTGISNKESDTSGGSFGIGKNAAFAASELQTVFYSTVYREHGTGANRFLAQGKTILTSHIDAHRKQKRATGYWGRADFMPVADPAQVASWLRRDDVGASVFVIGLRDLDGWQHRIAASLLQNFFCAVHDGRLRFRVDDGKIDVTAATLPGLFGQKEITAAAEANNRLEDFQFAGNLYRCLTSDASVREELSVPGLGRVRCTLLMEDQLPKRVMIIRNGMAITDSLEHFGDKFNRFPMYRDFVALVEPLDDQGSALIKRLENPRHDSLSAQRLPDERKRKEATATMKRLARAIREAIRKHALPEPESRVTLDELASFFADAEPSDRPPQQSDEEQPESVIYKPAPRRKRRPETGAAGGKGSVGGAGGGSGTGSGGKGGPGPSEGPGTGGIGPRGGTESVAIVDFRNIVPAGKGGRARRLFFTPETSCSGRVQVRATGLDTPAPLRIVNADPGQARQGELYLPLKAGQRISVDVEFAETYDGPLEIAAVAEDTRGAQ